MFSESHEHLFYYSRDAKKWKFLMCALGRNWNRCTAPQSDLPRGTKFDASRMMDEVDFDYAVIQHDRFSE